MILRGLLRHPLLKRGNIATFICLTYPIMHAKVAPTSIALWQKDA